MKESSEGVSPLGLEQEYVIDKPQPWAGLIELGVREILFKVTLEPFSIGRGDTGAHGHAFDLEEVTGVEGEVVGKDKLCELDNELSGW